MTILKFMRAGATASVLLVSAAANATTPNSSSSAAVEDGRESLRRLFIQFLDQEVAAIGRERVLQLKKDELFQRFLLWHARRLAN